MCVPFVEDTWGTVETLSVDRLLFYLVFVSTREDSESCSSGLFPFSIHLVNMSSQKQEVLPLKREEDVKRVKVEGLSDLCASFARNGKSDSERQRRRKRGGGGAMLRFKQCYLLSSR